MLIEQQIEELRVELSACIDEAERVQIEAELAAAHEAQRALERATCERG